MSDLLEGEGRRHPCEICKGACCEFFGLTIQTTDPDKIRWLEMHGKKAYGDLYEFNCRCQHLGPHGECKIYETRPQVCRDVPVGSAPCLYAINSRRPLNTANKIKLAIARMGKEQ